MSDEELELPWWAKGPGPEAQKILELYIVALLRNFRKTEDDK